MAQAKFDIKTEATRQFYAGVGVTDLAVEFVRDYVADAHRIAVVGGDAVPRGQHVDPVGARDVEDDRASDVRRERVDAELAEAFVRLHRCRVDPAVQRPVVGDVRERVDVGAYVAAGHDDLVRRRAAVCPHVVAVPALQCHLERRVVGRLRHAAEHRLREVDDGRGGERRREVPGGEGHRSPFLRRSRRPRGRRSRRR